MPYCSTCGQASNEGKFCSSCGTALPVEEAPAPPPFEAPQSVQQPQGYQPPQAYQPPQPFQSPSAQEPQGYPPPAPQAPQGYPPPYQAPPPMWPAAGTPKTGVPKAVLIAGAAAIVLLILGVVGYLSQRTERYPEAVRTTFLQTCQENGGPYTTCDCALTKFEESYSFEEYKRLEIRILAAGESGELPREVTDVLADCT